MNRFTAALNDQRLDARATAVRQGTRLLAMLPAGPVHAAEAARNGAGQ
jgi:hypothetical protein